MYLSLSSSKSSIQYNTSTQTYTCCTMNVGSSSHPKKPTLFSSSRHSPVANQEKSGTTQSHKCCRGLSDCIMGSTISHNHTQQIFKLEQQVLNLEAEVQKQREIRAIYKLKLERTQDYLRHCLEIAQDNGFLDLLSNNNRDDTTQECPLSSNIINTNTPSRVQAATPPVHVRHPRHVTLPTLIHQAITDGWYIEPHEIELHEQVGQGSTADIYRGTWRGLDVAVKCIYPDTFTSNANGVTYFAQEVETLSRQRHPFVLQLMGACLEPPDYGWVVTEFLSMTLKEWLHGPGSRRKEIRTVPLPPFHLRLAKALEIAQAMQYLHEQKPNKLIHRDLKPSNIFLDYALHIRIADFGHARFLTDHEKALSGDTGTYVYMAPEVFRGMPYDDKCDVFSFGIILNELITCDFPYIETDYGPSKIAMEVAEGRLRPALPNDDEVQQGELIDIIRLSWDENPSTRPSFATITCTLKRIQKKLMEIV